MDLVLDLLNPRQPESRLLPALLVTSVFGFFGYLSRGVTWTGAIAGFVASFLLFLGLGFGGFVTLSTVFAITWLATRVGYARKRQLGVAENKSGRNARQVLANVATAAIFAILSLKFGAPWAVVAVAALAEAAADTTSSEIGEALSTRAWLITGFRSVSPGTNGAVSLPGTIAGIGAAALVTLVALWFGVTDTFWAVVIAAFLGTLVDSLIGATLERAGRIGNDGVNFISTLAAAGFALVLQAT